MLRFGIALVQFGMMVFSANAYYLIPQYSQNGTISYNTEIYYFPIESGDLIPSTYAPLEFEPDDFLYGNKATASAKVSLGQKRTSASPGESPVITEKVKTSVRYGGTTAGVSGQLRYSFVADGPDTKNIDLNYLTTVRFNTANRNGDNFSTTYYGNATVNVISSGSVQTILNYDAKNVAGVDRETGKLKIQTGKSYDVIMSLGLGSSVYVKKPFMIPLTDQASAVLDPYFFLDADDANEYSLRFSDFIVNTPSDGIVSAVPLPRSAPMFAAAVLALGMVGYGMNRKKTSTAT